MSLVQLLLLTVNTMQGNHQHINVVEIGQMFVYVRGATSSMLIYIECINTYKKWISDKGKHLVMCICWKIQEPDKGRKTCCVTTLYTFEFD